MVNSIDSFLSGHKVGVVGLGYVGLPLAVEFGKKFDTVGFDINERRIEALRSGYDHTLEVDADNLQSAKRLEFSTAMESLRECKIFIVTVPTPVDKHNKPDLTPLIKASTTVGKVLKKGDIVIYESTVYPGATEEECVPVLERTSGLVFNVDFYCGYSPERINPGDKKHTITKIMKITSGSTPEAAVVVDDLYKSIISAGTHPAPSIKVAEAAKVIENAQRDINIAFVNELSIIFNRLGIDTNHVLQAAGTKWNFLNFKPGLVGGHCIGVDPYYLAQRAQAAGYHPEILLAGRRLNDGMGKYVATEVIKLMIRKEQKIKNANALILGITFKENCPDIRNSKVADIIHELNSYGLNVHIHDPWADKHEVKEEYGFDLIDDGILTSTCFDVIILAVAHDQFLALDLKALCRGQQSVIYDVKGILSLSTIDARL